MDFYRKTRQKLEAVIMIDSGNSCSFSAMSTKFYRKLKELGLLQNAKFARPKFERDPVSTNRRSTAALDPPLPRRHSQQIPPAQYQMPFYHHQRATLQEIMQQRPTKTSL